MTTATSYTPTVAEDCGTVTFSHPPFEGGFGVPNGYILYVNGAPQAYTPGEVVTVAVDGAAWQVTLKATYEGLGFEHQLGQSKGAGEVCPVETVEPVEAEEPVETVPVETPEPVETPTADPAELPGTTEPVAEPIEPVAEPVEAVETAAVEATGPTELAPTGGDPLALAIAGAVLLAGGVLAVGAHGLGLKRKADR